MAKYGITVLGPEKGEAAQMEPEQKPQIVEVVEIIEIVEIEEFAKRGEHVPHAKHYAFRVDKERVVVTTPTITGTEILAKVGKTPEAFKLYQHKRHHQPVLIGPHEVVDLRAHGDGGAEKWGHYGREKGASDVVTLWPYWPDFRPC